MLIKSIESLNDGLNILWNDDSLSCFPWLWLRDHSESQKDLHPDSKQRQIDVFTSPTNNSVSKVLLDKNSKHILIKWADNSESSLSFKLLQCSAEPSFPQSNPMNFANFWNTPSDIKVFPEMSYEELMSDGGIKKWLNHIQRVGFVLVTEAPATPEATKQLM